jgi:hypothetical protein
MAMPIGAQMIILGRLHLGSNLGVSSPEDPQGPHRYDSLYFK